MARRAFSRGPGRSTPPSPGLHDGNSVFYRDIGDRFLEKDGGLSREVMSDFLHLAPKGYQIWADAIKADVQQLLR